MFVVYAADSTNVTVSPRLGTGHTQPQVNGDAQISVLEGTGIASDGSLVANVRCDSCLNWSGGSMDPTDSSSSWIYAYKSGDALDSTSTDESISQHDGTGQFSLDLTTGTGGSSSNPFVASSGSSDGSASASGSATQTASNGQATATDAGSAATIPAVATATGGVSNPVASSNPSTSGSGSSHSVSDPNQATRVAHAIVMPLVFVILFPLSALTIYLPYNEKVRHIHAPLQVVSVILMLVGLGLGVKLANKLNKVDEYHQVIGYIVVAWMVFFQPALGLWQHLQFRKKGTRSPMGHGHRWLGRAFILLGIVNGGLGFKQAGTVGSDNVPTYSVVVYSIVTVVVFLLYIAVIVIMPRLAARRNVSNSNLGEKPRPRSQGYEMHNRSVDRRGYA